MLGAAGLLAGCLLAGRRRPAGGDRVEQRLTSLEAETRRHAQAIQHLEAVLQRVERGFGDLDSRLLAQTEILRSIESNYTEKQRNLQAALSSVIEAINEVRRARVQSAGTR